LNCKDVLVRKNVDTKTAFSFILKKISIADSKKCLEEKFPTAYSNVLLYFIFVNGLLALMYWTKKGQR